MMWWTIGAIAVFAVLVCHIACKVSGKGIREADSFLEGVKPNEKEK